MSEQFSTVGLATCRPAHPASPAQSCSQRAFVRAQLPSGPFRPHNSLVLTASLACAARQQPDRTPVLRGAARGRHYEGFYPQKGLLQTVVPAYAARHHRIARRFYAGRRGRALSTPSGMPSTVARPISRVQEVDTTVPSGSTRDGRGPLQVVLPGGDGNSRVCRRQSSDRSPVLRGT